MGGERRAGHAAQQVCPPASMAPEVSRMRSLACYRRAPVTAMNLEGYGLAFAAVCFYNFRKLQEMQAASRAPAASSVSPPGRAWGWVGVMKPWCCCCACRPLCL